MNSKEINKKNMQGHNFKVFDIRNIEKYNHCHIFGAKHIEKGLLLENPSKYINKKEKVYITCNSGNSASLIANILKNQGYNIESIKNGMNPLVKEHNNYFNKE